MDRLESDGADDEGSFTPTKDIHLKMGIKPSSSRNNHGTSSRKTGRHMPMLQASTRNKNPLAQMPLLKTSMEKGQKTSEEMDDQARH